MASLSAFSWLQSSIGVDITGEWDRVVALNVGGVLYSARRRVFRPWVTPADGGTGEALNAAAAAAGATQGPAPHGSAAAVGGRWAPAKPPAAAATPLVSSSLCALVLNVKPGDRGHAVRDESGAIVIDRDGTTFRHVLNFLRARRLVLPDDFSEWDLLLDDAAAYGLSALDAAIRSNVDFQRRSFHRTLPRGVFLRWTEGAAVGTEAALSGADRVTSTPQGGSPTPTLSPGGGEPPAAAAALPDRAELHPPLPLLATGADGFLRYGAEGRPVGSVDEAVSLLVGNYGMRVEHWSTQSTPIPAAGGAASPRVATVHTVLCSVRD